MVRLQAYFFLNFLTPASPARPEARRSMLAGSGTGALADETHAPTWSNA